MSHFPHVEDLNIEECDNLEDFLYPHQQNPESAAFQGMNTDLGDNDGGLPPVEGEYGATPLDGSPMYTPKMAKYEGPYDSAMTSRIGYDEGTSSQPYNYLSQPSGEQGNNLRIRAGSDMSDFEFSPRVPPDAQGNLDEEPRFGLTRENTPFQNAQQSGRTYTQAVPHTSQMTSMSVGGGEPINKSESPVVTRGRGRVLRNRRPAKAASYDGRIPAPSATATTVTKAEAHSVVSSNTGYSGETNHSVTARKMKKNNRERQRRYEVNEKFAELAEVLGVVQKNKSDKVSVLQSAIDTVNWFQETYGPVDINEIVNSNRTEPQDGGSISGRKRSAKNAGM
eukprot:gb/GECG01010540.1/.p1 GENE.gb/GECG01010540.1/~~gb/GECG01010540.1/.p1  ORF type:complete len:337 (+),score=42.08 gb/GECG01010540.1/:1-1011(+)